MTKNYSAIYEHTRNMIGSYAKENPEMMTAFFESTSDRVKGWSFKIKI